LENERIVICEEHIFPKIPLISTMVFRGAELWCPYCGKTYDIFGGRFINSTRMLESLYKRYLKTTKKYLKSVYENKPIKWEYMK